MNRPLTAISITLALAIATSAQQPATPAKSPAKSTTAAGQTPAKAPAKAPAKSPSKAPSKAAAPAAPLATDKDKFSYALGMNIAKGMKLQNIDVDLEILMRGLRDAHTGSPTQLTVQEMGDVLNRRQQEMQAKAQEQQRLAGEKNKREGDAFLAQNKARPGVVTLPSGLQYEVITEGTGPAPKATDMVTTHYRGTLIDGTEFDSSYKRGEPVTFSVGGVIKGWTEALQLMKVGSKWKLYIPSELAYGAQQRGQHITPNSTLLFEIELLAIKEPAAQK